MAKESIRVSKKNVYMGGNSGEAGDTMSERKAERGSQGQRRPPLAETGNEGQRGRGGKRVKGGRIGQ